MYNWPFQRCIPNRKLFLVDPTDYRSCSARLSLAEDCLLPRCHSVMPRTCIPGGVVRLPQKKRVAYFYHHDEGHYYYGAGHHETTPLKNDSFAYHDVWLVQAHGLLSTTFRESKGNDSFSLERIYGFLAKNIAI